MQTKCHWKFHNDNLCDIHHHINNKTSLTDTENFLFPLKRRYYTREVTFKQCYLTIIRHRKDVTLKISDYMMYTSNVLMYFVIRFVLPYYYIRVDADILSWHYVSVTQSQYYKNIENWKFFFVFTAILWFPP